MSRAPNQEFQGGKRLDLTKNARDTSGSTTGGRVVNLYPIMQKAVGILSLSREWTHNKIPFENKLNQDAHPDLDPNHNDTKAQPHPWPLMRSPVPPFRSRKMPSDVAST